MEQGAPAPDEGPVCRTWAQEGNSQKGHVSARFTEAREIVCSVKALAWHEALPGSTPGTTYGPLSPPGVVVSQSQE